MLLAYFANGAMLNFYGFVPVALGWLGNNRGAVAGGLLLGLFQQAANFTVGGVFASVAVFSRVHRGAAAGPAGPVRRPGGPACLTPSALARPASSERRHAAEPAPWTLAAVLCAPPRVGGACPFRRPWRLLDRHRHARAVYWVLVAGLNLVVGFAGQLAIGYVALLTLGAYTASALAEKLGVPAPPALAAAGLMGAAGGVLVGLPALRLRTFYFAMSTLGFATIVTQVALAWTGVTGGGVGLPGPTFAAPFDTTRRASTPLCMGVAALVTVLSANIGFSRFGRALVALRDAEVAAEACGVRQAPAAAGGVPVQRRLRRAWRARCSRACKATSRRTPSPSTCRCCSSPPS